ncbi:hypothetical protein A6A27_35005 [Micromonospora sp. CB01531]|nr:hypothetical protein A6A27_35005 [Micromonospora sp. CB01531]
MPDRQPLEVPAGTLLQLAANDWTPGRGDLPVGTDVVVVVSGLRPANSRWTWVIGHRPQCEYATTDEHPPCVELRVRTSVLSRHRARA